MRLDVLLYGTMGEIGSVVRDSLSSRGLRVALVDFPQNVFRDEAGYRRELRVALRSYEPDVIMPVGHTLAMARFKDELPCKVTVDSESNIRMLDSKVSFMKMAAELGLNCPRSFTIDEAVAHALTRPSDDPGLMFKRDISFGGHGVHRPRNIESLSNLIAHQPAGEPYLIQEYIPGDDYSVDALRGNGCFRASTYRSLGSSRTTGPADSREVCCRPDLEQIVRAVMDANDYRGVCGFDFRISRDGIPYILEANPRFTGGIAAQIESGFDIPYQLYRMALDGNL